MLFRQYIVAEPQVMWGKLLEKMCRILFFVLVLSTLFKVSRVSRSASSFPTSENLVPSVFQVYDVTTPLSSRFCILFSFGDRRALEGRSPPLTLTPEGFRARGVVLSRSPAGCLFDMYDSCDFAYRDKASRGFCIEG